MTLHSYKYCLYAYPSEDQYVDMSSLTLQLYCCIWHQLSLRLVLHLFVGCEAELFLFLTAFWIRIKQQFSACTQPAVDTYVLSSGASCEYSPQNYHCCIIAHPDPGRPSPPPSSLFPIFCLLSSFRKQAVYLFVVGHSLIVHIIFGEAGFRLSAWDPAARRGYLEGGRSQYSSMCSSAMHGGLHLQNVYMTYHCMYVALDHIYRLIHFSHALLALSVQSV